MTDFSKKSQTVKYFDSIMDELRASKVKAIFSLSAPFWNQHRGFRSYSTDTEVYVMLENGLCLIITYYFVDALDIEFRRLTAEEETEYGKMLIKDFFNSVDDIYDFYANKIKRVETCALGYDYISSISLRSVTDKYNKWIDNDVDYVSPTEETFDEIKFIMSNGKSFVICADDAEVDGYALVWSEDTEETITEISED